MSDLGRHPRPTGASLHIGGNTPPAAQIMIFRTRPSGSGQGTTPPSVKPRHAVTHRNPTTEFAPEPITSQWQATDAAVIRTAVLCRGYRAVPYWGWGSPELGLDVAKDGQDVGFQWLATRTRRGDQRSAMPLARTDCGRVSQPVSMRTKVCSAPGRRRWLTYSAVTWAGRFPVTCHSARGPCVGQRRRRGWRSGITVQRAHRCGVGRRRAVDGEPAGSVRFRAQGGAGVSTRARERRGRSLRHR